MSDPVAFGTSRLDEDEALASGRVCSEWKVIGSRVWLPLGGGSRLVAEFSDQPSSEPSAAEHVARHDPARALREVAAHRTLLAMHGPTRPYGESGFTYPAAARFCGYCGPGDSWQAEQEPEAWTHALWPCRPTRLLLAIWSDHPDYDQGWKP